MIVCCYSPWHKKKIGLRKNIQGITFVFNEYCPEAELCIDIKGTRTSLSRKFPPEQRIWVHIEPIRFTDYFSGFERYYAGGILSWHAGLSCLPQWRTYRHGGKGGRNGKINSKKMFGFGGHISAKDREGMDGYRLRRTILDKQHEIKIPSTVYNYTGTWRNESHEYPRKRTDEVMDYMFYLAIENCRENHYFTEKIGRAFANLTVPIYYGDPKIGEEFDLNGIILINEKNWLATINALTADDYYSRMEAMCHNFCKSKPYWSHLDRIAHSIKSCPPAGIANQTQQQEKMSELPAIKPSKNKNYKLKTRGHNFFLIGAEDTFSVNETAAMIWSLCGNDRTVDDIVNVFRDHYAESDDDSIARDVIRMTMKMIDYRFIEITAN